MAGLGKNAVRGATGYRLTKSVVSMACSHCEPLHRTGSLESAQFSFAQSCAAAGFYTRADGR